MTRRLALIAHDNKKVDIIAWATFNRETLAGFALVATPRGSCARRSVSTSMSS